MVPSQARETEQRKALEGNSAIPLPVLYSSYLSIYICFITGKRAVMVGYNYS